MERTLLVTIRFKSERGGWKLEHDAEELEELAASSGAEIVDNITYIGENPTANLLIGRGKAEEIALIAQEGDISTVIFSRDLSGTQQRNLEELIGKKTIDRTQLILDIFAQHARSPEGKLQVELAQLQYLVPRLIGKGIVLSRLGGGIGTRGPGEQKLEVDRRRIRKKIEKLRSDIKHLSLHRQTIRKKRKENALPQIALVGYTNAGKSTLINTLTGSGQSVRDSLFTTLDPLSKSLVLQNGQTVIISDTVGFLHNLPHHLIEAFQATLEEVSDADLLIHVLDASHPLIYEHAESVLEVLRRIGAINIPAITALNKIDIIDDKTWLAKLSSDFPGSVMISALNNQNIGKLTEKISEEFKDRMNSIRIIIPHGRMDLVDMLYRQGQVDNIEYSNEGIKIKGTFSKNAIYNILRNKEIDVIS